MIIATSPRANELTLCINMIFFSFQGYTALHLASIQGHDEVIHQLVQVYRKSPFLALVMLNLFW